MTDVSPKLSLLKFYADWCGPCKRMEPTVKKLQDEFKDIDFISVDIDDNIELSKQYSIKSVPTLVLCKDGEEINRVIGMSLIDPLRNLLREAIKNNQTEGQDE